MTTSNKLYLKELVKDTASRESGKTLRQLLLGQLAEFDNIELNCDDVMFTPSFVDEAFGLLCHSLTLHELMSRIKFTALSPAHKTLLTRVINRRFLASPP